MVIQDLARKSVKPNQQLFNIVSVKISIWSRCSKPHVKGPIMQTSLVLLVLRKLFSLSSVSVTASTSIVFGSEGGGGGGGGVAPLLSGIVRWEVEARRVGKRRRGKERVGDGKWGVWEWKVVVGDEELEVEGANS